MHLFLLYLHSYLRWLLLGTAILVCWLTIRGLSQQLLYSSSEKIANLVLLILMDIQFLVGLLLYAFFSGEVRLAWANLANAMKDSLLRFYAVEHLFLGFSAVVLLHVGNVLARQATSDHQRRKRILFFVLLSLLLILLAIPWPFREPMARPLLRY